jgi:hypothetical protein
MGLEYEGENVYKRLHAVFVMARYQRCIRDKISPGVVRRRTVGQLRKLLTVGIISMRSLRCESGVEK